MWSWLVGKSPPSGGPVRTATAPRITKNPNGERIREEFVQKAVNFLSHPSVRDQPELHVRFLESKGLTPNEIQESLNRVTSEELIFTENDSIFVLPAFKYEEFLCRLRHPDALDVRNSFQSFINVYKSGFGQSYSLEDKSKMVHNLVDLSTEAVVSLYEKAKIKTPQMVISECVERYLMTELFDCTFVPICGDLKKDALLFDKIVCLERFLSTKHLDIPPECTDDTLYGVAQEELLHINSYKAPRDKLMCIVKACKIIFSAIQLLCKHKPVNADLFLPVLIYNIVKANPPYLKTNMSFIQHFRHPTKMRLESGYFFVSFSTAVTFLEEMTSRSLTIDPQEYDRFMEGSIDQTPVERAFKLEKQKCREKYDVNEHLFHSCAAGDFEMVKHLVKDERALVNITQVSSKSNIIFLGDSPLSVACRLGNTAIVQYLLEEGALVNMLHHPEKRTVLHLECMGHEVGRERSFNYPVVKLLVEFGADIHLEDKYGLTPLHYAQRMGIEHLLIGDQRTTQEEDIISLMENHFLSDDWHEEIHAKKHAKRGKDPKFLVHELSAGDTLQKLGQQYSVDIPTLKLLNNLDLDSSAELLSATSKIYVPGQRQLAPVGEQPDKPWLSWNKFF